MPDAEVATMAKHRAARVPAVVDAAEIVDAEIVDAELVDDSDPAANRDLALWTGSVTAPVPVPTPGSLHPALVARIRARVEYGKHGLLWRLFHREPQGWRRHDDA